MFMCRVFSAATTAAAKSLQSCRTLCNPMDCSSNAEEAEVEWFYEDLQDLLELIPKKDVLFIIGDLNAKLES